MEGEFVLEDERIGRAQVASTSRSIGRWQEIGGEAPLECGLAFDICVHGQEWNVEAS